MVRAPQIAKALGGRNVLRERLANHTAVIHRTDMGLPYASLEAVGKRYGIPLASLARVIGLPARTLARRKVERRLSTTESDRLVRVARIASSAEDVLETREKAGRWLQKPNRALGGAVPLELLRSDLGAEEVETILVRIDHGVYS
jgi:putative toxin-antitoxin system antitoxin component (TIGR02293 family)